MPEISLKYKLSFFLILLTLLPTLTAGIFAYRVLVRALTENTQKSEMSILENQMTNFDIAMYNFELILNDLVTSESTQGFLQFRKEKESEIYYATYVAGGDFTAQDVIDGKVVDVAANMAKFPITPIHSSVGCDCPNTVSLCNNRLIWATSGKKVYTLTSANQYSERNVFELSDAIQPELNGWDESLMKEYAFSVDWDGNYFLFCLDKAVVFNYGGNAFANISSYADPKKAQRYMGWYIWAFVDYAQAIKGYVFGGVCQLIGRGQKIYIDPETGQRESYDFLVHYHFGGMSDTALYYDEITGDTPIHSMFQTKLFDFGRPERRKNVRKLHIGATDVADGYITLSYVTEFGTQEDAYRIGMYGDGDMRVWAVTPHVNRIRRFGIRADSAGAMAVDGMVIRYEVYGEVR